MSIIRGPRDFEAHAGNWKFGCPRSRSVPDSRGSIKAAATENIRPIVVAGKHRRGDELSFNLNRSSEKFGDLKDMAL